MGLFDLQRELSELSELRARMAALDTKMSLLQWRVDDDLPERIKELREVIYFSKDGKDITNIKEVLVRLLAVLQLKVDYHEPMPGRIEVAPVEVKVASVPEPKRD